MRTAPLFTPDDATVDTLVAAHPLAQLVSVGADGLVGTPLPLLLERADDGLVHLLGHFARANPHVGALERDPHALAVFMGPHGYISPSWFTDRTQAPTWNLAAVHMRVLVAFDRSRLAAREAVDQLTKHMEQGRPHAWSSADMGERYEKLLPAVVAFRGEVLEIKSKLKLGQNERLDVLAEALEGLVDEPSADLCAAMRRANLHRLTRELA